MEGQAAAYFKYAKDAQLDWISPTAMWAAEHADARIGPDGRGEHPRPVRGGARSSRHAAKPPRNR